MRRAIRREKRANLQKKNLNDASSLTVQQGTHVKPFPANQFECHLRILSGGMTDGTASCLNDFAKIF